MWKLPLVAAALAALVAHALAPGSQAGSQPGSQPGTESASGAPVGAGPVLCGIDVLVAEDFATLAGARVGLVTNQTGRDRAGRRTADLLHAAAGLELVALFSPEHGPRGELDREDVASSTDPATGLVVHSLYGEVRRPTPAMLAGLDTLVFDVQDAGARFYTYASTLVLALEAAAEAGLRFVVLDRPNPLGGAQEGPVLDAGRESFIGLQQVPVRHGLTLGELALLFAAERGLDVRLDVVRCAGWTRATTFERTGLAFVPPSPNLRRLSQVLLYPGVGLLEFSNLSVGRGTDTPFERIGAPWVDARALAARLAEYALPGFACTPVEFTPRESRFAGELCHGLDLFATDWERLDPVLVGLALACALRDVHGERFDLAAIDRSLADAEVLAALRAGKAPGELPGVWANELARFRERCAPHLLYP